ncbi:uncharacterized protein LOC135846467 [Planococcus citri]|uniref:uncharacterized protein LOC135846467 n=1 Tax=Planococcus citri TaxID=170843 RepID=UPI0031F8BAAF
MDSILPHEQSLRSLFNESPSTLESMCCLKISLSLWQHVLYREKVTEQVGVRLRSGDDGEKSGELVGDLDTSFLYTDVEISLKSLQLPEIIEEYIQKSCKQAGKEMNEWKDHIKYRTVRSGVLTMFRSHLKCCTWNPNGTINYKESARKFVSIASIDKAQKFEIAAQFCLEDVMADLCESPDASLLQLMKHFTKKIRFLSKPVLFYWLCKFTEQMNKLPTNRNSGCVEALMLTPNVKYYWWSIEYFFQRLSEEQTQITKAIELIQADTSKREFHPKELASKLNESQLTAVLFAVPVDFLSKLIYFEDHQLAFSVWTRVKDWIIDEQFVTLMAKLMENRDDALSVKIWNSAYNNQKNAFLSQDESVIVKNFLHPGEFSISVLSYASVDRRKELIFEYAYSLAKLENHHRDYIEKVIRICLPNASNADVQGFRKAAMKLPAGDTRCGMMGYCGCTRMGAKARYKCDTFLRLYFPEYDETLSDDGRRDENWSNCRLRRLTQETVTIYSYGV